MTQACIDGLSDSVANMQSTTSPYVSGTESQATSGAGELQRLRYVLKTITGWPNWYRVDLPVGFTSGTHLTASALHIGVRGSAMFPALTFGQDHTTGFYSPAAHHLTLSFDATSDSGRFGSGQTNARSYVAFHAAAVTLHHTVALRFASSEGPMQNGQRGHVTALRVKPGTTGVTSDTLVLGHSGSSLTVESSVSFTGTVTGVVGGAWGSRGQFSGTGATTNAGHVFTLRAHLVSLFDPATHTVATTRVNPSAINVDISDVTTGTGGGATPNGADRKATFNQNTWIHFYWIWHASASLLRGVASEQPPTVGPNLPSGFGSWSYAGAVRRGPVDASPLVGTHIMGSMAYIHSAMTVLNGGTATTETTVNLSSFVPPNATESSLMLRVDNSPGAGSTTARLRAMTGLDLAVLLATATDNNSSHLVVPNISQRVFYLLDAGPGGNASLDVLGYKLPNGGS